jgi:serine phosphatase RsbU (regulator of sigma subunit)/anti-anti-sigma regulatory factor
MSSSNQDSGEIAGALGAYETAPAIMLACEGDEMVLASANEAARAALGDHFELGRPVRELAPRVVDQLTSELADDVVATVYATGRSFTRPACRVEVQADDEQPFELFWDVTVSPWFADDGSVRGVLAHGIDVTETTRARRRAAVEARSSRQEASVLHDVITLQDALLPQWLPVLPGVEVAARYLLAQSERAAGGDWYDAVGLGGGRVALMVGDVVGHGVAAASVMGQLRAVLHERLTSGSDLGDAMLALDVYAGHIPEARAATLCVAVFDTESGRLDYCTAGHPPPLVVRPGASRARYLRHSGAAPLATTGEMKVAVDHVDCEDLVILYTDGLLARPGRGLTSSTVELGQVAVDAAAEPELSGTSGPADRVCDRALELTTGRTGYADDIAVLVAEITEPVAPLHLDLAADDDAVPAVLDALAEWLESMRVRDLDHIVVQHAVDELVSNVVDHAYTTEAEPESEQRLAVDAELLPTGDVQVRFADTGRWIPPQTGLGRGRGLTIVRGMVDRLRISGDDGGTVATVQHRLSRPAPMLTGVSTVADRRRDGVASDEQFVLVVDGARLSVAGPLDSSHVDDLRGTVTEAVAGPAPVVVDLAGVTRLSSAAVQALHGAQQDAAARCQDLVVYAPPGTTAQHVLELVRLPYVLTDPSGAGR